MTEYKIKGDNVIMFNLHLEVGILFPKTVSWHILKVIALNIVILFT